MKIVVEVELEPNEVPLAQELLNTIRALTDHVKSSNQTVLSVNVKNTAEAVPHAPVDAFYEQIIRLADPAELDEVVKSVSAILDSGAPNSGTDELLEAVVKAAFDSSNIAAQRSTEPFMRLLHLLPDPHKGYLREKIISKVLSHLTVKRPGVTNREEFYLQAEAFAHLVDMAMVSMDGAVQTVIKLMKKPDTRAAAITMLGQTLDKCLDKVSSCQPQHLAMLQNSLATVKEEQFTPDLQWIFGNLQKAGPHAPTPSAPMPMPVPAPTASASMPLPVPAPQPIPRMQAVPAATDGAPPPAAPVSALSLASSFGGGEGYIFALAYDPVRYQLIAGGKDLDLTIWSSAGQAVHRIPIVDGYVCGVDVNSRQNLMTWCGVFEQATPIKARISLHTLDPAFTTLSEIARPEVDMFTCVRFLPDIGGLISGESMKDVAAGGGATKELLAYYDVGRVAQSKESSPVSTFEGHAGLITCVSGIPGQPHLFVSGSRDNTVRLWDMRAQGPGQLVTQHTNMVTSCDTNAGLLVTASLDEHVSMFDLRMLSPRSQAPPVSVAKFPNGGVLKVAIAEDSVHTAAATVGGLYLLDFARMTAGGAPTVFPATAPGGKQLNQYNDIKWAVGGRTLYAAASDTARIDTFELQ